MEKYYVYILYSERLSKFYKGSTSNLDLRVQRHNSGYETYTKTGVPWRLIWHTEKSTKSASMILEKKLKNLKNLSVQRSVDFMIKYSEEVASPDELLFLKQLSGY